MMPAEPPTPATSANTPLICALLRGESPACASAVRGDDVEAFVRDARYHGVTLLLDARFHAMDERTWPAAIRHACQRDALVHSVSEPKRRTELERVLAGLAGAGLAPLLLKGTGLAYSHYPNPALRPRADCDLLVAPAERAAATAILQALGYRRVAGPAGAAVGFQVALLHEDAHGATHNVDLHWRLSDLQSFAWLFTGEELAAAAVPVPALGPHARRLGDVHALVLALLHRAGSNLQSPGFGDRLIWLYDVHLLVEAMGTEHRARFCRLVEDRRIVAIASDGLRRCASCFRSPCVAALADELDRSAVVGSGARLLDAHGAHREWLELRAIPTMAARVRYVATRLFPSGEYLRERFPDAAERTLPVLHARRWLAGLGARSSARER